MMSWDVMIFRLRHAPRSPDDLAEDNLLPLGPAAQVREAISAALPATDWSDPTWGDYVGDGFSIEFNVGDDDPIENIMLHVRGGGDAISTILKFVVPNNWHARDDSSGCFLDPAAPSDAGWVGFQEFRDEVIRHVEDVGEDKTEQG